MLTVAILFLSAVLVAFVLLVGGVIVALTLAGARRRASGSGGSGAHPLTPLDPYAVGGPFAVRPGGVYDPNMQYGQPPTHHHQPNHHAGHMGGMGGTHGGHMGSLHSGGVGSGGVHGGH